jgi:hypothetical protein
MCALYARLGNRGHLLKLDLEHDVHEIQLMIENPIDFEFKSKAASNWSTDYTLDVLNKK